MDCALYFTHTFAERGSSYQAAGATLLLDQSLVKMAEDGDVGEGPSSLAGIISEAQLNGVPIDTVVHTNCIMQSPLTLWYCTVDSPLTVWYIYVTVYSLRE